MTTEGKKATNDEQRLARAMRLASRTDDVRGSMGVAWLLAEAPTTIANLRKHLDDELADPLGMPLPEAPSPLTMAEDAQMIERVGKVLTMLGDPYRTVIERIYGMQGDDGEAKKDIALDLGHSETRMRKLEISAIRWIKQPAVSRPLRSLLDYGHIKRGQYQPSEEAAWAIWRMAVDEAAGQGSNPAWAWRACPIITAAIRLGLSVDDLAQLRSAPAKSTEIGAVRHIDVAGHSINVLLMPGMAVAGSARIGTQNYRIAGIGRRSGGADVDIDAAMTLPSALPDTITDGVVGRQLHQLVDHPLITPGHRIEGTRRSKAVLRSGTRALAPAPPEFVPPQATTASNVEEEYDRRCEQRNERWVTPAQARRIDVLGQRRS